MVLKIGESKQIENGYEIELFLNLCGEGWGIFQVWNSNVLELLSRQVASVLHATSSTVAALSQCRTGQGNRWTKHASWEEDGLQGRVKLPVSVCNPERVS
jgi:hypothetical protein